MTELEGMIFKAAIEGIMKLYGFNKKTFEKLVIELVVDWSIKVSHCSCEQRVDMIIG